MPQIGSIGIELDLLIKQGGSFGPHQVTLTNPDTTPVNLTGCSLIGQIRKTASAVTVAATLTCTITSAVNGVFTFALTDEVTASLTAGDSTSDEESQYVWDMHLLDAAGNSLPLYYGVVRVFRGVSRA